MTYKNEWDNYPTYEEPPVSLTIKIIMATLFILGVFGLACMWVWPNI